MYNLFKRNGPFPQTVYIYVHIQTKQNADYIYIGVNLAVLNTRKFKKKEPQANYKMLTLQFL